LQRQKIIESFIKTEEKNGLVSTAEVKEGALDVMVILLFNVINLFYLDPHCRRKHKTLPNVKIKDPSLAKES
jgi:hypothetical protein